MKHKMNMRYIPLLTLFLWSLHSPYLSAKVWINELMQSNIDLVRDDIQEFPDSWIELYNDSDEPVDIQNWTISDNADYRKGWKIEMSVTIAPKSYCLIYADKASQGLHTDFRLDSGSGGSVFLFDENGQQIDAVLKIPKQAAPNIARGRISDGSNTWANFVSATPGAENTGKTSDILLSSPIFSRKGGIFRNNVNISLSLPSNAPKDVSLSNIHYTLDNSEPTVSSPSYEETLTITATTVVRAKLIHPNYLTDRSSVHTYIISADGFSLPVISISTDSTYLWDDEFGIYCQGNGEYGLTGNGVDYKVNWNNDWRRPVNFEYFPVGNNSSVLNQLGEMRIAGGWSRANPQKTLIVYGNKRFGIKRFEYDIFEEKPNQEIKSFMIRNSGNDFWSTHFRDAATQLFMGGKVDVDYQAYQPAIFYLNGEYWGIQNLRERSTEDFVLANYATEDIDMIEDWWGELKAGDKIYWNELMNELRKASSERNYQWIIDQIDIDEYINYMILQIYVSNTDYPGNNMVMWRPRKAGGQWRFIIKDTDHGLGGAGAEDGVKDAVTHNALKFNTADNGDDRKLFNALLTQDSFRQKLYSRFAVYMGDLLHYNSTSQVIDSIQNLLEPSIQDHLTRWNLRSLDSWRDEISKMKEWCGGRNVEVYEHIRDFFSLGAVMSLKYEASSDLDEKPAVFINDVAMRSSGLDGSYFQGEDLKLRYENETPAYGWEITQTVNGTTTVNSFFQQDLSYQIAPGCTSMSIRLVAEPSSTEQPESSKINISVVDNQLRISDLQLPSVISIYDINGKLVVKTTTTDSSILIPFHNKKGVFVVEVRNNKQKHTRKVIL